MVSVYAFAGNNFRVELFFTNVGFEGALALTAGLTEVFVLEDNLLLLKGIS